MRIKLISLFIVTILNGCLFSYDDIESKHIIYDFHLQDNSLIQNSKDAKTDAIIVNASEGPVNSIGWNNEFILVEQNLNSNTGAQEVLFYIVDLRNYNSSKWNQSNNVYKCFSINEFETKRNLLQVPDSIDLLIADPVLLK